MVREKPINKVYLSVAFGVSLSTVSCPFLIDYSVSDHFYRESSFDEVRLQENPFPYVLGGIYVGLAFACGFNDKLKSSKPVAFSSENSCFGRVPLEELLDADELKVK
ncbi:MAG: hypothetical protein AABX96_02050 [Nanoarchaeota archaeon]